ncbi:MAG: ABC transporter permease subunit [Alphaproteobacteria bacterium]|nr:ABC transporter permease subunit [Alphaproteobacteria bacterium]
MDRLADWTIRIGGIGVILAVFGIMAFLAEVVVPLFTGGEVLSRIERTKDAIRGRVLVDKLDEYRTLSVALTDDGRVTAFHVASGRAIEARDLDLGGGTITSFAHLPVNGLIALGFADGSVRFGRLGVEVKVIASTDVPATLSDLGGGDSTDGRAVYTRLPGEQVRRLAVLAQLDAPQSIAAGKAIVGLDYRAGGTVERPSRAFVTVDSDGVIRLSNATSRVNLLTRQVQTQVATTTLPELPPGTKVSRVLMTEKADQIYVAGEDGQIFRFDTRDFAKPMLAEQLDLAPGEQRLTLLDFLNGEQSIVVGTSAGAVDIYFRLQREGARSSDGYTMVRARSLEPHGAPVMGFAPSIRTKSFLTADAAGNIWFRHATSEQTILKLDPPAPGLRYEAVVLAPRDDGILAIGDNGRYYNWRISVPHPETTLHSIFGKVWYEGYAEPSYTWQSSSGTDTFEPKFSLVPLIFGTIKATLYCMLFAVPIALAAAIFTSEFVNRQVRAVVKPTMEMMASLPSVVLGFIAALILAPIVENWIASVILAFAAIPLGLFLGAYLWQMLPERLALRFGGLPKFALMFLAVGLAGYLAWWLGGAFERLAFAGDFKAWANGTVGSDAPFLALLLLPLSFIAVSIGFGRAFGLAWRDLLRALAPMQAGMADFARWALLLALAILLALALAWTMTGAGLGPRGTLVDTYVQRNTLVVGFAMGFAVIPIIYTIAEDALNAVPEHLRAASLACGATPWQTAISIILPTAMSGVFAAIMIGMGRAVGETMIVVMAAGNTPVMEWNIFSGLRALSANIAVELPEAVKDDTLYRMLFLAALTLFAMTFVINTLAELIRQRFRKRAMQL